MAPPSYGRHRFPTEIIQHAIWLYLRFTLSYRDVEELLGERGFDISYETVRRGNLELKGLRRPVATFNVVQSISAADARPNLTVVATGPGPN